MDPGRRKLVEWIFKRMRVGQQQSALAEIVEHQAGQHDCEPGQPNRTPAEMSHVGVHGFAPGHGQEGRSQNREAHLGAGVDHEADGVQRVEGGQDGRGPNDAVNAQNTDRDEPEQHDRAEHAADEAGAAALHQEQGHQHHHGDGQNRGSERGRIHLQSLDGGKHRNGRGDGAVPVEQRRADQTQNEQCSAPGAGDGFPGPQQRQHGHDAAFPPVVGAQDQDRVFQRDDEDERPEDDRHGAGGRLRTRLSAGRGCLDGLLQSVEWARADIAVNDAERPERRRPGEAFRHMAWVGLDRFPVHQSSAPSSSGPEPDGDALAGESRSKPQPRRFGLYGKICRARQREDAQVQS